MAGQKASIGMRAVEVGAISAGAMYVFQAGKQALDPNITMWASHVVTIVFTAMVAVAITWKLLKKEEGLRDELRHSYGQYRVLFENNPVAMWVFARKSLKFLAANEAALQQYGYSRAEFLAMTILDIRPEEDVAALMKLLSQANVGLRGPSTWRHRKKDGTLIDVEVVSHAIDFYGVDAELVAVRNVTERKREEEKTRQAEEKYRSIFEESVVGIYQATPEGRLISVNRALAEMHGYTSADEMVKEVSNVAKQVFVEPARMAELQRECERSHTVRDVELEVYQKDGTRKWVRSNLRAVRNSEGAVSFYEGSVEDITERKRAEKQVQYLAYYDALTGLPNRTLLKDRLGKALASARRRQEKVGLIFLDLDRFKFVNDSLGHAAGDLLLQSVAERLTKRAREQDTVARVGGDEFVVVETAIKDEHEAAICAERIMDAMVAEFAVRGQPLSISCSVGISVFPDHGNDEETLLKNADAAMYSAKEDGRNTYRFFTQEMNVRMVERLELENNLRQALERKEFSVAYQPQVDIRSNTLAGVEALIRWKHPKMGYVPPDKFIQTAENCGLITAIGEWVLRTACAQAREWQEQGILAVPVAVNVSAVQFRQPNFLEAIRKVLKDTRLAPEYLELELTESLLLSNADVMISVLRQLKEMGIKLAIDDFGTGYSSLTYLKQFPVSKLKIDRSFVQHANENPDDAAIATAIVSMAKSLNLRVIAEGVETEEQMAFLRARQCDEVQGYYYSKPLPAGELIQKLRSVLLVGGRGERVNGNGHGRAVESSGESRRERVAIETTAAPTNEAAV